MVASWIEVKEVVDKVFSRYLLENDAVSRKYHNHLESAVRDLLIHMGLGLELHPDYKNVIRGAWRQFQNDNFIGNERYEYALHSMQPADDFCDVMTVDEFADACGYGCFIPDDGDGYFGTKTQRSCLSVWQHNCPSWATHVHWYNK